MIDYYRLASWGPMLLATLVLVPVLLLVAWMAYRVRGRLIDVDRTSAAKTGRPDSQAEERAAKIATFSRTVRLVVTVVAGLVLLDVTIVVLILTPPWVGYVTTAAALLGVGAVHLLLRRGTAYPAPVASR